MYRVSAGKMRVRVKMRGENEKQYGDDGGGGGDDDDGGGGSAITNAMVVTRVRDDEKLEEETLISTSTTTTTTRRKDMRYNLWTHSVAFMILFSGMTTFSPLSSTPTYTYKFPSPANSVSNRFRV